MSIVKKSMKSQLNREINGIIIDNFLHSIQIKIFKT